MRAIDHQRFGQFAPKGLDWQDLRRRHILNIYGSDFFHYTCSYIDPQDVASFDSMGLVGRIYVGDY